MPAARSGEAPDLPAPVDSPGRVSSDRPARDWGRPVAIGVGLYTLAYVAWTAWPIRLGGYEGLINELADYPALVAAVVLMLRAAATVGAARARRGWRLMALACTLWIVANGVYDYITLVQHDQAFPSVGDLLFVACFPVALAGLLSFPEQLGRRGERIAFALDASTLMVGGGAVILHTVLLPVAGGHEVFKVALVSFYPLADMVLGLCVVTVLFRHLPARTRGALRVLFAGFVALFIADLVYARRTLAGDYTGTLSTDSLWTVGYAILAIGAHLQHRTAGAGNDAVAGAPRSRRLSSWLPAAAVIACLTVLAREAATPDPVSLRVVVGATILLVALVVARQLVVARENVRIEAENTARAGEARLRTLLQQSTDVISIVDPDGAVRYVSPSAARSFGAPAAPGSDSVLTLAHPDDRAQVRAFLDRLIADPDARVTATWRHRHADGRWIHVEVVGTSALTEASVAGLVLNLRDVSERVELEHERARAAADRETYERQLLQAQKMEAIGRLAGGVAHDMNNALQGIIVTAELLTDEGATDELRADAEAILLSARRAAELTRNLLGFARHGPNRQEPVRPETLVTSVVGMLARTLDKGIQVETSFAAELAAVEGDPAQLYHALLNLCINAADAIGERGVLTLGAHLVTLDEDAARIRELVAGPHVVLSVKDTGTGMDDATRQRAFEPFFTTKPVGQGTGLGLAMVYGTVKRHRGAIEVDSALGQGSTFRIFLPAMPHVEEVAVERPRPVAAPRVGAGRVLVVDDEPMLRTMVQRILEKHGYQVSVAANGQAGLAALATEAPFDLVLLDMAMPVMAGPEMFRRARAADPSLRVLLTSGFASTEDSQALLREGAYGLVSKPYSPAHLLAAVAAVMSDQRVDVAAVAGVAG